VEAIVQNEIQNTEDVEKLRELIKDIRMAMLTTLEQDGSLRSRPMATQETEFDGDLWFFTEAKSPKSKEIQDHQQVNVTYTDPDNSKFVSVSGKASLVHDPTKSKELWNPAVEAWFPSGPEDPSIALIKVEVESAEYWDGPSSKIVRAFKMIKGSITKEEPDWGENKKIDIR
jgi:general stress protein 26